MQNKDGGERRIGGGGWWVGVNARGWRWHQVGVNVRGW